MLPRNDVEVAMTILNYPYPRRSKEFSFMCCKNVGGEDTNHGRGKG
ncbi:MAG TPA: hypothetical protein VG676_12960 [Chitinophagaceae bacterium]|nr:hypothetical protein [Chitinophagaceae bacterium]